MTYRDEILTGTTTLGQSGHRSNGYDGILNTLHIFRTGASALVLVSYLEHPYFVEFYSLAVYSKCCWQGSSGLEPN